MIGQHLKLNLIPEKDLIKTGPVDHADWNYRPILGWIQKLRFRLILSLLPFKNGYRLLEVGYGSGVLMPELSTRYRELYGIDIHSENQQVHRCLKEFGVEANLFSGSAEEMPFGDSFFDCIVAVSSLEFIDDIEIATMEIYRILKPDGILVLVTPGNSTLVDFAFRLLTGKSAKKAFENRRQRLLPTLLNYFEIQEKKSFPLIGSSIICLYTAFRMTPKNFSNKRG